MSSGADDGPWSNTDWGDQAVAREVFDAPVLPAQVVPA
jgi:hypothetical protein